MGDTLDCMRRSRPPHRRRHTPHKRHRTARQALQHWVARQAAALSVYMSAAMLGSCCHPGMPCHQPQTTPAQRSTHTGMRLSPLFTLTTPLRACVLRDAHFAACSRFIPAVVFLCAGCACDAADASPRFRHFRRTDPSMAAAKQGTSLQNYNNELVKCKCGVHYCCCRHTSVWRPTPWRVFLGVMLRLTVASPACAGPHAPRRCARH